MLKRFAVPVFALLAFASPVAAHHTTSRTYPAWVDAAWQEGKRCKRWEPLIRKHGLPVKPFSYLAWREARCRPDAVNARWDKHGRIVWTLNRNGTFDSGLWQVNSSWVTVTADVCGGKWGDLKVLLDPTCNVKVAAYLFREGGFRPWGW